MRDISFLRPIQSSSRNVHAYVRPYVFNFFFTLHTGVTESLNQCGECHHCREERRKKINWGIYFYFFFFTATYYMLYIKTVFSASDQSQIKSSSTALVHIFIIYRIANLMVEQKQI
jgi:hypothetical protein